MRITLADYKGPLRQVTIADQGHEEPTILLTNQLTATAAKLIKRYARRMIIENSIEDGIDFFHMDALSSAVAMKVDCDLQLTLMASSLYRLLAGRIDRGYEQAKSRHLFHDFVDTTALVTIGKSEIVIPLVRRMLKREINPLDGPDTRKVYNLQPRLDPFAPLGVHLTPQGQVGNRCFAATGYSPAVMREARQRRP